MASCKQAKNLFDAKQVNSGDRIVKFVYLAFFAGLTISPDSKTIKTSWTAQIAQSILIGWTSSHGQTSLYCSRGQKAWLYTSSTWTV